MLNKGRTNVLSRIKRRSTWPTTRRVSEFWMQGPARFRMPLSITPRHRPQTILPYLVSTPFRDLSFIDGRNWHALIRIGRIMVQISYIYIYIRARRFAGLIPSMQAAEERAGRRSIGTCAVFKCYRITPRCGRFGTATGTDRIRRS